MVIHDVAKIVSFSVAYNFMPLINVKREKVGVEMRLFPSRRRISSRFVVFKYSDFRKLISIAVNLFKYVRASVDHFPVHVETYGKTDSRGQTHETDKDYSQFRIQLQVESLQHLVQAPS